MPGPFVNIEDKQDSAEQLAATQGIPSQFKYSAAEWNLLRDKIEQLHSILQGEIDLVATTIKNEFRLVDLSGTNANQYILSRVIHWLNNLEGEDKIVLKPNVVFTLEAYYAVGSYVIKESWQIKQEGNLEDKTFGVGEAPAPLSILLPIEKTIKLINQGNTVSLGEIGNPPNDQNGNPISAEEHISNEVNILLPNEPARQGFVFNALFNGVSRNFYFNGPNAAYGLNGSQTSSNQFYEFKETTNEEDVENVIEKTSQIINDGEDGASRFIEENELEDLETDPTVPQYIKDLTSENIENFATAFQENIINVVVTGDQNKQLTLTKRDGSTIVATFTDNQGEVVDNVVNSIDFNEADGVLSIQTEEGNTLTTSFDGRYALWSHNHEISEVNNLPDELADRIKYGDKNTSINSGAIVPRFSSSSDNVLTNGDFNNITEAGWYFINGSLVNRPNPLSTLYYLNVIAYSVNICQIAYPYGHSAANAQDVYIRLKFNTWGPWRKLTYQDEVAPINHTHIINDISGLSTELGKMFNKTLDRISGYNLVKLALANNSVIGFDYFEVLNSYSTNQNSDFLANRLKPNTEYSFSYSSELISGSNNGPVTGQIRLVFSGPSNTIELGGTGLNAKKGTFTTPASWSSVSVIAYGGNPSNSVVRFKELTVNEGNVVKKWAPTPLGITDNCVKKNGETSQTIEGILLADSFKTTDGNYKVETFSDNRTLGGGAPTIQAGVEVQGTFESVLTRLLMGIDENGEAYFQADNHFTIRGKNLAQLLTDHFQLKITTSGYTFKEVGVGGHTVFKLDPERFINIAEVTLPKNSGQLMALAPNAITSDNVPNVTYNEETGLLKEIDRPVSTFINTSNTGFSARNITYNVVNGRLILIGGATASADAVEVELLTLPTNARPDATRIVTNIFYELTINTNGVVTLANVADGQSYNIDFEITLNFL
jgi:hypothetical protein